MGKNTEIFSCVFDPRGVMDNWMMEKTQISYYIRYHFSICHKGGLKIPILSHDV